MQSAFNRSGYAIDTGGFLDDVANVSFDRLKQFHRDFYGPANATIVITGNAPPKFLLYHIANEFSHISNEGRVPQRIKREEEPQHGTRQVVVNVEQPVCMLMLAYRGMEGTHRDSIVCHAIKALLSHPSVGVMSQLEEMGICPQSLVDNSRQKHRYLFSVVGSLISPVPQLQQVAITLMHQAFDKLKTEPVDPQVLEIVKLKILNDWENSMSTVESLGSQLTEAVAMGNLADTFNRKEALKKVTAADVQRVAQYLFVDDRLTLGIIKKNDQPTVLRPLQSSENYSKNLMKAPSFSTPKNASMYVTNSARVPFQALEEDAPMTTDFGQLHRLHTDIDRVEILISAKSATDNQALAKICSRLIREGLPKSKLSHDVKQAMGAYQQEAHTSYADIGDSFQTYMIENNIEFGIDATKSKLHFRISFKKEADAVSIMQRIAKSIRGLDYTNSEEAKKIQMKSQMLIGELHGAKLDPRSLSLLEITNRLFHEDDINHQVNPDIIIQELQKVTYGQIEQFKNGLISGEDRPLVASVAAPRSVTNEQVSAAVRAFHQTLTPEFYTTDKELDSTHMPFTKHPSLAHSIENNEKYLIRQLDGRNEGLSAIGIRIDLDKNSPEYTALAVGVQALGGGKYTTTLSCPLHASH